MSTIGNNILYMRKKLGWTQEELADKMGYKSKSSINKIEMGLNDIPQSKIKMFAEVLGVTPAFLMGWDENPVSLLKIPHHGSRVLGGEMESQGLFLPERRGVRIPVLGNVAAGIPLEAITDIEDYEEISEEMAVSGEYVALKIHGDSMEPRMLDGDVVVVRVQETIESGETAIVMINGDEATCKRVKITPDGLMLIANNPDYEPMFYTKKQVEDLPVRIFGKVVELRAKFR